MHPSHPVAQCIDRCREFRGPVTALAGLEGNLALAAGSRLEVHGLEGNRAARAAFFDAPFLIASLVVVRKFLLAGDAAHGPIFLQYRVGGLWKSGGGSQGVCANDDSGNQVGLVQSKLVSRCKRHSRRRTAVLSCCSVRGPVH